MSDKNTSTAKSYLDSAVAQGQSVLGSLTGSTGDKNEAAARKDQAAAEKEASHSVGKLGPLNVSPSGGVSTDDPNRTEGKKFTPPPTPHTSSISIPNKKQTQLTKKSTPKQDPTTKPSARPKNPSAASSAPNPSKKTALNKTPPAKGKKRKVNFPIWEAGCKIVSRGHWAASGLPWLVIAKRRRR
ncbi:MAG: hypothetical protein Q9224_005645 [Gallowayella concinna]